MRMMSLRNWIVLGGLSLSTAACGTVKEEKPDAAVVVEDTTAPKLMSSTPADAATKVSVLSKLTFTFDEALDPATVTDASFSITFFQYGLGIPVRVKGAVSYDDATHTVTFTPALAMTWGQKYSVHITAAVKDVAGNAFAGADQVYQTAVNSNLKTVYYNSATGQPSGWYQYVLDANGRLSKSLYYNAVGPDGNWFTNDDVVSSRYDLNYSADGRILDQRFYQQGPDGIWNTPDDVLRNFYKFGYDAQGRQTEQTRADAPGPDNQWGTADDPVAALYLYTYAPKRLRMAYYDTAGNDGVWRTPDDHTANYTVYTFDDNGSYTRYAYYSAGADGLAETSDDACNSYTDNEYNQNFQQEYSIGRTAGPDNVFLTADDGYSYIGKYEYDAKGVMVNYVQFTTPGPDGVWRTADDVPNYRSSGVGDANGLLAISRNYSGPGPDARWNTADDVVANQYTTTYDANGTRTDYKGYQGPGQDNVWGTPDDRLSQDTDFDLTR